MTWFRNTFTIKKVLRASAIAALVPGATLLVAPAAFLGQIFVDKPETPDKDDKLDMSARGYVYSCAVLLHSAPGFLNSVWSCIRSVC